MFRILMFFKNLFSRKKKFVNQLSESRNNEKPIESNLETFKEIVDESKNDEVFAEWENPSEMDCYTLKDAIYDSKDWYKYSNNKIVCSVLEIEASCLTAHQILEIVDKRVLADDFTILDVRRSLNKLFHQEKIIKNSEIGKGRNKQILWQIK